jgi:hypothetical protein
LGNLVFFSSSFLCADIDAKRDGRKTLVKK